MGRISVTNNVSLDGVMQAPGRPDEDRRGGFDRGGWAAPFGDEVMAQKMGEGMSGTGVMLFGRRTYQDFAGWWPYQTDNPFTPVLNRVQKYVVSRSLIAPLTWQNSTLLPDLDAVADLKNEVDGTIVILGSGVLIQALRAAGLVDEYNLLIHPVLLGSGSRLFPEGTPADLTLADSVTTTTGAIIARYEVAGTSTESEN